MYTITLKSVGNPDHGQYAPVSNPQVVAAWTLVELRDAVARYIAFWDLGGGNWCNPIVKRGRKVIGFFSYNGTLWKGRPTAGWYDKRVEIAVE